MKNVIKYKGYTIVRNVAVFENGEPIGEFDSMADAKAYYKDCEGYEFKYAAAEEINADGDVNPSVYGDTLKEATDKLKAILSPRKMTWKELRHEFFSATHELRDAMLKEYNRNGEETKVPEFWQDLHNLWTKMNTLCEKL
jgi:hypothetical protein